MSPFVALSGHRRRAVECPLSGEDRTSIILGLMSAFDPERTSSFSKNEAKNLNFGVFPPPGAQ
jgi:hypothetical protein